MAQEAITLKLRPRQMEVYESEARFRVLAAGRRFGKTHLALAELVRAASAHGKVAWYVAPSYRQAKRIAWQRLKNLTRDHWAGKPSETELSVRLQWGASIALKGADQPDSLRGNGLDFVVMDEYASMRPECWTEVIRPALADREGRALFIGTPRGCNHFFDRFEQARTTADWAAFQFTSVEGENVTAAELVSAASELDAQTYRQEFQAEFGGAGQHRAYYAFDRAVHVKPLLYEPREPLVWALDFNVDPMCAVMAQKVGDVIHVLDELVIHGDGNTEKACNAFLIATMGFCKYGLIKVEVYGDASGHQRRTSGTNTDWGIVKEFFGKWRGTFASFMRTTVSNPGVRDRVNSVNGRLESASGERRLFVDPRCKELIKDLERVNWALDTVGRATSELDKGDRMRTHTSDALGYFVGAQRGLKGTVGERGDGRIV